jgi:two-component system OmpR family sensor kinase
MRRIEDESARMGVLVEDLLTLARLDEVREAATEPVDLAALAHDAVADARATDPGRPISAVVDEDDEVIAVGDPDQLRQVVANLVRNALVHTPPGTAVEVGARSTPAGAELRVRDHGPGLPTADVDALFGRFWRAEGGRERGRAGAGLGLAIVDGIVRAHGGRVHAENAADGGAVFTVLVPAAVPASSQPLPALP